MGKIADQKKGIGWCIGDWNPTDKVCSHCFIVSKCEEKTKREQGFLTTAEEEIESGQADSLGPIDPIKYLLNLLDGKYEHKVEYGHKIVSHTFCKDDRPVFFIGVSDSGKIKVSSSKGKKNYDKIDSVDQVEEVLKEFLPLNEVFPIVP